MASVGGLGSTCFACMDDFGYNIGEATRQGAILAMEVIRTTEAANIADLNYQELVESYQRLHAIAQRSLLLAERQQDRLSNTFWTRETEMLAEFGDFDSTLEPAETLGRRYAGRLMASVTATFAKQLHTLKCNASKYCTSAYNKARQDLLLARATAQTNAKILGYNIGYAEFQARTDTNWNRRMQVVALGRGLMNEAARLTSSAGEGLASVAQNQAAAFGQSVNALQTQFRSALDAFGDFAGTLSSRGQTDRVPGAMAMNQASGGPGFGEAGYGVLASSGGVRPGAAPWMFDGDSFMNQLRNPTNGTTAFEKASSFVALPDNYGTTMKNMFPDAQHENQMNNARVGNLSLARTGTVMFPVVGVSAATVTVPMNAFGLDFTDNLSKRPATGGGSGTPIQPFSTPMGMP